MKQENGAMNLYEFRSVYRAGGFRAVGLQGDEAKFVIWGKSLKNTRVFLITTRTGCRRYFATPAMALLLLQGMGVTEAVVELEEWRPREIEANKARPDLTHRMRKLHQSAKKYEADEGYVDPAATMAKMWDDAVLASKRLRKREAESAKGPQIVLDAEGRLDAKKTDALNQWLAFKKEREAAKAGPAVKEESQATYLSVVEVLKRGLAEGALGKNGL